METISAPKQAAIRDCKVNESFILVAGDDDLAHLFNVHDLKFLQSFRGHEATIFFAALNHDSSHVVTGDNDGVLLAWKIGVEHTKPVCRVDDGHDLGITSGDCMPTTKGKIQFTLLFISTRYTIHRRFILYAKQRKPKTPYFHKIFCHAS